MGRLHLVYLDGRIYSCKHCHTHLALYDDIVSKSFHCRHGKAYLFSRVVNVSVGQKEERLMMTGMHTVTDIFCVGCGSVIGWKYVVAHEKSQKYKEGKFILESCSQLPVTKKESRWMSKALQDRGGMESLWMSKALQDRGGMREIIRAFKVLGPDGNSWVGHEGRVGTSDAQGTRPA